MLSTMLSIESRLGQAGTTSGIIFESYVIVQVRATKAKVKGKTLTMTTAMQSFLCLTLSTLHMI